MKRLAACVLLLTLIGFGLLLPALIPFSSNPSAAVDEPTTITNYDADFTLADDGDLTVVETLTVDFPVGINRHGLFRFWDRFDSNDTNARRNIENVEVTMDGAPVEVDRSSSERGRFSVARIGSPDVFVTPGQHTYRISYSIDGVIIANDGNGDASSAFYWDLIPVGWAQEISASELRVHLPAPAETVRCAVGIGTERPGCDLTGEGTNELVVRTGPLRANTPVTLRTALAIPTPPSGNAVAWPARFDPALGSSVVVLGIVGLAAAAAAAAGLSAARTSIEVTPPYPLMYGPPEGIGPAQASFILHENPREEAYIGTIMHAAEQRAIDLQRTDDGWTMVKRDDPDAWSSLDPISQGISQLLDRSGGQFSAVNDNVTSGEQLKAEIARFDSATRSWAVGSGHLTTVGLGSAGPVLVVVAIVATVGLGIWNPLGMSMVGLIPGGFAAGAISLLLPGAATKRTATGRDLWSRVGGFRRVLSTPSSQDRFDFSGRKELYTAYLPWAIAFGCADAWAEKYRTEVGTEPPLPIYFGPAYMGMAPSAFVDSMVHDFRSTLDSAISSYNTSQAKATGGGGGGFSGGGGGGGGGGGSW